MNRPPDAFELVGTAILVVAGALAAAVALIGNPLVLRPRFWTFEVVARSFAQCVLMSLLAIGLLGLRRWAAVLSSGIALIVFGWLAVLDFSIKELASLLPVLGTVAAWRVLRPSTTRFIASCVAISVVFSGAVHYVAYAVWIKR